jgi:hypothetical protein
VEDQHEKGIGFIEFNGQSQIALFEGFIRPIAGLRALGYEG